MPERCFLANIFRSVCSQFPLSPLPCQKNRQHHWLKNNRVTSRPTIHGVVPAHTHQLLKRLLNFIADIYVSQTKVPFYILTSNPQIIGGNMANWKITRYGHMSKGKEDTRINNEIRSSISRKRITVSLQYVH